MVTSKEFQAMKDELDATILRLSPHADNAVTTYSQRCFTSLNQIPKIHGSMCAIGQYRARFLASSQRLADALCVLSFVTALPRAKDKLSGHKYEIAMEHLAGIMVGWLLYVEWAACSFVSDRNTTHITSWWRALE
jgi:hypothetical protein